MTGIAIFGAGRIGRIHADNLCNNKKADVRHVVDVVSSAAEDLAAKCNARVSSIEEAIADEAVDAVVIATSTDTHAELIEVSAKASKAIFCEKPLDLDVAVASNSVEIAAKHGTLLCLGFNRRHDPTFNRLKQDIDAGSVGNVEVVSITSRDPSPPPREYIGRSGGLFRDMMIHDLDMARWLLGEDPVQIFASGSALVSEDIAAEGDIDTAVVTMRTASGRLCNITNSRRCVYGYDQRIEVFGSAGMVRAGNQTETQVEYANGDGFRTDPVLPFFLERYADAYRLQLDRFLRAVAGDNNEMPDGIDGLKALKMADAAQLSCDQKTAIALSL
jgi:myo-inositol 2-dehydrogenase/D-chiro-inositol 1-dehydrogenase